MKEELSYEVLEEIAVLSENTRGWHRELNLVSWSDRPPKSGLCEQTPNHERMGKSITLTSGEFAELNETTKSV